MDPLQIIQTEHYLLAVGNPSEDLTISGKYLFKDFKIGVINSIINGWIEFEGEHVDEVNLRKIYAVLPLNNAKPLEGVYLLPDYKDELTYMWACESAKKNERGNADNWDGFVKGYSFGYKAAGGYTEEDMRKAYQHGVSRGSHHIEYENECIQSLKPIPKFFEPEMIEIPDISAPHEESKGLSGDVISKPLVENNILQGKYIMSNDKT